MNNKKVSIIMGSYSDWSIMSQCTQQLEEFEIPYEVNVISAHRALEYLLDFVKTAPQREVGVFIAGAGGAAHLPGVIAGMTHLPVIGVPIKSSISIDGWDSILSILQMPSGVPVATMALNGAKNAAIFAAQVLSIANSQIAQKLIEYKKKLYDKVIEDSNKLNKELS